jgi:aspartate carbamoyltransferase regulatory subunit
MAASAPERTFKVFRIENGTVIDHVPHWSAFKVLEILGLRGTDSLVTVGFGMYSDEMGRKDLVKVENRELTAKDINKIALVAPNASINRIQDSVIIEKFKVRLPDEIEGLVRCCNPGCITHGEPAPPRYKTLAREPVRLRCHYCLHVTGSGNLELL